MNRFALKIAIALVLVTAGIIQVSKATYIPFGFWLSRTTTAVPITISSNVTITDANYATYQNNIITINTGVTVTMATTASLTWSSLTMTGTAAIVATPCTASLCLPINLTIQGDASLDTNSKISANGAGYLGGQGTAQYGYTFGNTTSGGAYLYAGGSHAGYGGSYSSYYPNETYGSITSPNTFGGGGGSNTTNDIGGAGGGVISLNVGGTLTVNGSITANGNPGVASGSLAGGGAGGSVQISATTIATNSAGPVVTANGGTGTASAAGGGGGGRIAIVYTNLNTFAINSTFVQAYGALGAGGSTAYAGGSGTIFAKSASQASGDLWIYGSNASSYKNTKVGVFGQVSSSSSSSLTTTYPINGALNSRTGRTLKPDIGSSSVVTVSGSSGNSLASSTSLTGLTSSGKYFYLTDFDTTFDNVNISGATKVDAGYLNVSTLASISNTATLNVYTLNAATIQTANTAALSAIYLNALTALTLSSTTALTPIAGTVGNAGNPLSITAASATINSGSSISVNGRGYSGAIGAVSQYGYTYGGTNSNGSRAGAGGSHGGYGGQTNYAPTEVYGNLSQPNSFGSGGGANTSGDYGGAGGGVLTMNVSGTLALNGLLSANAGSGSGSNAGGGAGGSINLTVGTLSSSSSGALITANGSYGVGGSWPGGGGGRIAIVYGSFSGFSVNSTSVTAIGGLDGNSAVTYAGGAGTIFARASSQTYGDLYIFGTYNSNYKNTKVGVFGRVASVTSGTLTGSFPIAYDPNSLTGKTLVPDSTQTATAPILWNASNFIGSSSNLGNMTAVNQFFYVSDVDTTFNSLTVSSAVGLDSGFLNIVNQLSLSGTSKLNVYNISSGSLVTANTSALVTNTMNIAGALTLNSTTAVYPFSNSGIATSGNPLTVTAGSATIAAGASLSVTGQGYQGGIAASSQNAYTYGNTQSGASAAYAGGSHGGYGGSQNASAYPPNETYGQLSNPTAFGAGGGAYSSADVGGWGGGVLRLTVTNGLTLNGTLVANGNSGYAGSYYAGGGAGGSIYVKAATLSTGTSGPYIQASGGVGSGSYSGGGGGGRIAVYYTTLSNFAFNSTYVVANGATDGSGTTNYSGGSGTIFGKGSGQTSGDLYIYGPYNSNYKNTKVGVFGQVTSLSTDTITSSVLISSDTNALVGKTLKPDITLALTTPVTSNSSSTVSASGSLSSQTAVNKYFYITDSDTTYDNVNISNVSRVDAGLLNIGSQLNIANTAYLNAYTVIAGAGITLSSTGSFSTVGSVTSATNISVTSGTMAADAMSANNLTTSGSAALKVDTLTVTGTLTLGSNVAVVPYPAPAGSVSGNAMNITAGAVTINSGASINVSGYGYLGSTSSTTSYCGYTTGGVYATGSCQSAGGSHAGYGGTPSVGSYNPTELYGSLTSPNSFGAGGGAQSNTSYYGGAGGGILRMTVTNTLLMNGPIYANGVSGYYGGGGAGGSIYINAGTIQSGTSGPYLTANGAQGSGGNVGGGGGGRIAVLYGTLSTFALNSSFIQSYGGLDGSGYANYSGGSGTIFAKGTSQTNGDVYIYGPYNSNFRNTRVGAFGQVAAVSGSTLTTTLPFYPASLAGYTLKPDITQAATAPLTASTQTVLTSSSTLTSLTAVNSYFYVTDFDTKFDNFFVSNVSRADVGYLNIGTQLNVAGTAYLNAYTISTTGPVNVSTTGNLIVVGSLATTNQVTYSGSGVMQADTINAANLTTSSSGALKVNTMNVSGVLTLGSSAAVTPVPLVTGATYGTPMTITAGSATLASGSAINVSGFGYQGSTGSTTSYCGYTIGNSYASGPCQTAGASHGGYGGTPSSGTYNPNEVYGSATNPNTFGTGGGAQGNPGYYGGNGGGILRMTVTGTLLLNGILYSNGTSGYYGGGGAGGSIYVNAGTLQSGTSGPYVYANGAQGSGGNVGGGGGGRVAIYYGSLTNFTFTSSYVQAYGGLDGSGNANYNGSAGTIFGRGTAQSNGDLYVYSYYATNYKNTRIGVFGQINSLSGATLTSSVPIYASTNLLAGNTLKPDITQASTVSISANTGSTLTAASSISGLTSTGKYFFVTDFDTTFDNVTVTGAAKLDAGYLNINSQLNVTSGASLYAYQINSGSTMTFSTTGTTTALQSLTSAGAINLSTSTTVNTPAVTGASLSTTSTAALLTNNINVSGLLSLASTTALVPQPTVSGGTVGNAMAITAGSMTVASGATINMNGYGYNGSTGSTSSYCGYTNGNVTTGSSCQTAGGSHAGYGGSPNVGSYNPNEIYGSLTQPTTPGSGGGAQGNPGYAGGAGGGAIKITVSGALSLNGYVYANGNNGYYGGGGAGGSIYVTAGTISAGASGPYLQANGGSGSNTSVGGGGGGRIAVYYGSLSGFAFTSSYITANGGPDGSGSTNYSGGSGTIFGKSPSQTYGELFVYGPYNSNYKNTRVGLFGQVSSVTSGSLTSNIPFYSAVNGLAGYTLKPDITQSATAPITANSSTSISSSSSVSSLTSVGKYFLVTDLDTNFDNVTITNISKLDAGLLNIVSQLTVSSGALLNAYSVTSGSSMTLSSTASFTSLLNVVSGAQINLSNSMILTSPTITATGQINLIGTSQIASTAVTSGDQVNVGVSSSLVAATLSATNSVSVTSAAVLNSGTISSVALSTANTAALKTNSVNLTGALTLSSSTAVIPVPAAGTVGNAIAITAQSATINSGASINVNGLGYSGSTGSGSSYCGYTNGNTYASASCNTAGGSYGGYGGSPNVGSYNPNEIYGSLTNPNSFGSGGGAQGNPGYAGGAGGGIIRMNITNTLSLSGNLYANGNGGYYGGGGSGGSIYLNVGSLSTGTSGPYITANGGQGSNTSVGGGGGGRIAVIYGTLTNFAFTPTFVTANAGYDGSGATTYAGGAGTIFGKGTSQLSGDLYVYGPSTSNYKNTRVGFFGQVTGTTTNALSSSIPFYAPTNGLVSYTLKPDITLSPTVVVNANTSSTVSSASTVSSLTSTGKYFYVTDLDTTFDNVFVSNAAKLDAGYLNIGTSLTVSTTASLNAYTLNVGGTATLSTTGSVSTITSMNSAAQINLSNGMVLNSPVISASDQINLSGTAQMTGTTISATNQINLSGSAILTASGTVTTGAMTLGGASSTTAGTITAASFGTSSTAALRVNTLNVSGALTLASSTAVTPVPLTSGQTVGSPMTITASSASLSSSASINLTGFGYQGSTGSATSYCGYTNGNTTTGSSCQATGGSHAGYGGAPSTPTYNPNELYGSLTNPNTFGSGGGAQGNPGYYGGNGGGVLKFTVTNALALNGYIYANGSNAYYGGGGAGGSINISAGSISTGTSGPYITANGSAGSNTNVGGGGGGRISVRYGSLTNFTFNSTYVTAYGGSDGSSSTNYSGGSGTIFGKSSAQTYGDVYIYGPYNSNYKNTRVGVFGPITSISSGTLSTSTPIYLGAAGIVGNTLKPDYTQAATAAVTANTATSITIGSSLGSLTAVGKSFVITDVDTTFDNFNVSSTSKVDVGYLNIQTQMSLAQTSVINALNIVTGAALSVADTAILNSPLLTVGGAATLASSAAINSTTMSAASISMPTSSSLNATSLTTSGLTSLAGSSSLISNSITAGTYTTAGTSTTKVNALTVSGALTLNSSTAVTPVASQSGATVGNAMTVSAQSATIASGASINVTGAGYIGSQSSTSSYCGYTYGGVYASGSCQTAGGSYGGYGGSPSVGSYNPNEVYGSLMNPNAFGSGGGAQGNPGYAGGNGGGLLRLTVTNTLALSGTINANGNAGYYGGGGSGGSVYLNVGTLTTGTSGPYITANGGQGSNTNVGGGGGGRIAILYGSLTNFTFNSTYVTAYGGLDGSSTTNYSGGSGTIFGKSTAQSNGDLFVYGSNNSNYKNTRVGIFGKVTSTSTNSLTSNIPVYADANALSGFTLKPDITQASVVTVSANTNSTVSSASTVNTLTAIGKYFFLTDFDTTFDNLTVGSNSKLDAGYLNIGSQLNLSTAATLNAYTINTGSTMTVANASTVNVVNSATIGSNFLISNTSTLTAPTLNVAGTATFNDSTVSTLTSLNATGATALNTSANLVTGTLTAASLATANASVLKVNTVNLSGAMNLNSTVAVNPIATGATVGNAMSFTAASATIGSSSSIVADGQGYIGGQGSSQRGYTNGNTTTGGAYLYAGGSYGGFGGGVSPTTYTPNNAYGSLTNPASFGSGGGTNTGSDVGGSGGGSISVNISGTLTLNGKISANGNNGYAASSIAGGGSGGSINLVVGNLSTSSSGPVLTANGGQGSGSSAGGGGGGRISVTYNSLTTFSLSSTYLQAYGGLDGGGAANYSGGAGSIYGRDATNVKNYLLFYGNSRASNYKPTNLGLASNMTVEGLTVTGSAALQQENSTYALAVNILTILTSGSMSVPTNGAAGYGSWFSYNTLIGSPTPSEY